MTRRAWWIVGAILAAECVVAYRAYPKAKPWMRAGYVWLFETANQITGNDFEPPDRFK